MNFLQFILEGLQMASRAIRANRQRAFLTMLGVATGIFAITGILTMLGSLESSLSKNLASLGNTTLFVHHWPWAEGGNEWYKFYNRPRVSYRDFQKLKSGLDRVEGVSFGASLRQQVVRVDGQSAAGIEVVGVTQDHRQVVNMTFEQGRFFTEIESHLGSAVCIVGASIADALFLGRPAVGQSIRVGGKRLKVIGIQTRQGAPLFPGMPNEDEKVYVPYRFMAGMANLSSRSLEKVITLKAKTYDDLPYVENSVEGIMRAARGLRADADNNFAINKQEALMDRFDSFFGYLETGGWVISIFSILIGGFSIGNIMYISVRERTGEIGVQKALGATRPFILFQFVMEAVLICVLGGLLGLMVTFGVGGLVQLLLNALEVPLTVAFTSENVMLGLGLSVIIGLVSGVFPSIIAARMDPVEAIRQA